MLLDRNRNRDRSLLGPSSANGLSPARVGGREASFCVDTRKEKHCMATALNGIIGTWVYFWKVYHILLLLFLPLDIKIDNVT